MRFFAAISFLSFSGFSPPSVIFRTRRMKMYRKLSTVARSTRGVPLSGTARRISQTHREHGKSRTPTTNRMALHPSTVSEARLPSTTKLCSRGFSMKSLRWYRYRASVIRTYNV
jgi:hypothetical protein